MPTREEMSVAPTPSLADRLGGDDAAATVAALPEVAEAYAGGADGVRLHAALMRARKSATSFERPAIDDVLRRRRLFATRIGSAPGMVTVNGIGTLLYGEAEPNPRDGTSIATLYVSLLYVPLLPLASYVVRPAGGGFFRRSWQFFAKVPLSEFHRMWRVAALFVLAALVLRIGYGVWHRSSHARLHVVNGLDVPLIAAIDGEPHSVTALGRSSIEVSTGRRHVVTTTAAGERVEEVDLDVPSGTDLVAYVVLGASSVHVADLEYSTLSFPVSSSPLREEVHAGEPLVTADRVRYVFEEPPKKVSMSAGRETRRWAFVEPGGWKAAISAMVERKDAEAAAALAGRVAALELSAESIATASSLLFARGPERAREFLQGLVAKHPDSIEAHRAWQTLERSQGRLDALIATYRADYERKPTAQSGYLYARLLPRPDAGPLFRTLVQRFPDDLWLRRASAWTHLLGREFAPAVEDYDWMRRAKPAAALELVTLHATALVGAGRTRDAQHLAEAAIARGSWDPLILLGRLERLPGADASMPRASSLVARVADPGADLASLRADLAGRTGDVLSPDVETALQDPTTRAARRLDVLARSRVQAALEVAGTATSLTLQAIDDTTRLLLACEATRVGDVDLKKRILESGSVSIPDAGVDAPEEAARSDDIDLETRAILEFSASRRTMDEKERERLLSDAKADDVLRFVVWGQK